MANGADVAQAKVMVVALSEQARDIALKLTQAESGPAWAARAKSARIAARELRRDLGEVQSLVERLVRRFPDLDAERPLLMRRAAADTGSDRCNLDDECHAVTR